MYVTEQLHFSSKDSLALVFPFKRENYLDFIFFYFLININKYVNK